MSKENTMTVPTEEMKRIRERLAFDWQDDPDGVFETLVEFNKLFPTDLQWSKEKLLYYAGLTQTCPENVGV